MPDQPRGTPCPEIDTLLLKPDLKILDLRFVDQICIWAFRVVVNDGYNWARVEDELQAGLPPAAARVAYSALRNIFAILNLYSRRPLCFRPINCLGVSLGERLVLGVIRSAGRPCANIQRHYAFNLVDEPMASELMNHAISFDAAIAARSQIYVHAPFHHESLRSVH